MQDDTSVVELDRYERGAVLVALSDERNRLIADGRPTDTVDDALLKIARARTKRRDGRDEGR